MASPASGGHELLPLRPVANSFIPIRPSKVKVQPSPQELARQEEQVDPDLTRKNKLFVEHWLTGMTDEAAALKAGYAESTAKNACIAIRRQPAVQREIRRRLSQQYKDCELTTDEIVNGWRRVTDANILDYVDVQPDGSFKVNLNKVTREMADVIDELSMDAYGRPKIKLANKQTAREMLARFKNILSVSDKNQNGDSKLTIESLDAMVKNYTQHVTVNQTINNNNALPDRKALQPVEPQTIEAV